MNADGCADLQPPHSEAGRALRPGSCSERTQMTQLWLHSSGKEVQGNRIRLRVAEALAKSTVAHGHGVELRIDRD